MEVIKTREFVKSVEKLPPSIRKILEKQEKIFKINWLDLRLHTKKIKELTESFFILETMPRFSLSLAIGKIFTSDS